MCSHVYQTPATESISVEDDRIVNDHTAVMQNEVGLSAPNIALIDDRMDRTFERRKLLIQSSTVDVVLDTFPALPMEQQARQLITFMHWKC